MDKNFNEYKEFCRKKSLKENSFTSLQEFFQDKELKNFDFPISVSLPMSNNDRIQAIEDYYIWANKNELGIEYCSTFLEYKKFLFRNGRC